MGWPAIISAVLNILGKSKGGGGSGGQESGLEDYQFRGAPNMPQGRQQILGNPNYRMMGRYY